jgi:IS4 transposase
VLKNISFKEAFFISRLKYGTCIFEKDGTSSFNLLYQLRRFGSVDVEVLLGTQEKVPVRLVAIPVPEHVAAERRRKAKLNRDKRLNLSKNHLALLNWNIFILNVPNDILTIDQIAQLYRLRWRIEIIIKSWKSHFHLSKIPNASVIRVYSFIYAMLIFLTLFQTGVMRQLYQNMKDKQKNQLSLFSVSRFYKEQIWAIILYCYEPERIINQLHYHCRYESRLKRTNHIQKIYALG